MENLLFEELPISKETLKATQKMGFTEMTPIQKASIPLLLEGRDIIAQAPTGTGKTCAFGIPLAETLDPSSTDVEALILGPTRELVIQIAEELRNLCQFKQGIKIVPIYGGQPIERQILSLKRKPQIIVATPGRLMDHMRRKTIRLQHVKFVILDEADEMLNMGFREDIDTILESVPRERQTALFSATISEEIMEIADLYQNNAKKVKVTHKELTVPTIAQYYIEVKEKNKVDMLSHLIDTNQFRLSLIFCNTKRRVDMLTDELKARGYSVEALHGDMKQSQRDRVMARFRRGAVNLLVATDVAARGIDVDDIEAVINFDIPNDEEYYVHRIGRTGRAKKKGISYTFASGKEIHKLRDIMRYTKSTIRPLLSPSGNDLEEIRIKQLYEEIDRTLTQEKLKKYADYVEQLLQEDPAKGYTPMDIAAALLYLKMEPKGSAAKKSSAEERDQKQERSYRTKKPMNREAEEGMTRLFINLGTEDRIKPGTLVEMIAKNTRVQSKSVGAIEIHDQFSFVEVPQEHAAEVIAKLHHIHYKGMTLYVEKAAIRKRKK